MVDQSQINDLIIILRDLVKDFDKIIDQAKLIKGKVLGGDFSPTIHLANKVSVLVKKYKDARKMLDTINLSDVDGLSEKYIHTYRLYLETVSIPYIRDLVIEIKEIIDSKSGGRGKYSEVLKDLLSEINGIV